MGLCGVVKLYPSIAFHVQARRVKVLVVSEEKAYHSDGRNTIELETGRQSTH